MREYREYLVIMGMDYHDAFNMEKFKKGKLYKLSLAQKVGTSYQTKHNSLISTNYRDIIIPFSDTIGILFGLGDV